jgi:hypothetical protein
VLYLAHRLVSTTDPPIQTIVADVDGDGRPDVVISGLAMILYNRGTAFEATALTFQTSSPVPQGTTIAGVADVNGDGHPDIVLSDLSVVLGPLTPGEQQLVPSPISIYDTPFQPNTVFGDLNGDGRADAAFWSTRDQSVHVFLGQADGSFKAAAVIQAGYDPLTLAAIDLDHDGRLDLVLDSGTTLGVLFNNGNLTFSTVYLTVSGRVESIATTNDTAGGRRLMVTYLSALVEVVADSHRVLRESTHIDMPATLALSAGQLVDIDGDGVLDAVASSGSMLVVRWGAPDGTFASPELYGMPNGKGLTIADLNGDGAADILPFQYPGDSLAVVWGIPRQHSLKSSTLHLPSRDANAIASGDLNGDGVPDSIRRTDPLHFAVWFGDGNGGYTQGPVFPSTVQPGGGLIADFDGDHHSDFLLEYFDKSMDVFFGDGTGHFAATPLHIPPYSIVALSTRLDNGASSLLIERLYTQNPPLQEIRISAAREASAPTTVGPGEGFTTLLNIDSGGASEIITSAGRILKQTSSGWTDAGTLPIGNFGLTTAIVAADFNGDGLIDFFDPGSPYGGSLYLASASGYTRQAVNLAEPFAATVGYAIVEDVDGDGRLDLILVAGVGGFNASAVAWVLHNTADHGFVPGPAYPVVGGYGSDLPLDHAVQIADETLPLGCAPRPGRIAVTPQSPRPGEGVKVIVQLRELANVSLRENGVEIATAGSWDYAPVFTLHPTLGTHIYEVRYSTARGIVSDEVTVTVGGTTSHRRTAGH